MLICIAGESGVGKTTIAKIVELFYGKDNVVQLSTDDLHLYERNDPVWENITHLNPKANNLKLGDSDIKKLKSNKKINRIKYNHLNGKFDSEVIIYPKPVIINEGLHGFYSDYLISIADIKIYISVEEQLKNHWKIIRDINNRGYTKEQVLKNIEKRKKDAKKIDKKQKKECDILISIKANTHIKYIGDEKENISIIIDIFNKKSKEKELVLFLKKYIENINKYIEACKKLTNNDSRIVSGKGGNISCKIGNELMIIKKSGFKMSETKYSNGYVIVNKNKILNQNITSDSNLDKILKKSVILEEGFPSMETMFHAHIPYENIVHTHPKYLLSILCLKNVKKIIKKIYSKNYEYEFIEYKNPGFKLGNEIAKKCKTNKKIFFLENHGLIIADNCMSKAILITQEIEEKAKKYIEDYFKFNYYFPDSAVLQDPETKELNLFIGLISSNISGGGNHLKNQDVSELRQMESEKRRQ